MPPDANPDPTRVRRRLAYALIGVAVVLVLVFTPPLVNLDRYRHRIVQTMSDSLGRPVHIDDVRLRLLPIPSLELRNVVVSEDPAFGAEPTIRANLVEAILRPSSLWRRRIEFSTIRFAVDENGAGPSVNLVRNAAGRWNLDSVFMQAAHVSSAPTAQRTAGPEPRFPYIEAVAARVNLKLGQEKMPFSLTETDFALWLPSPDQWHVRLKGHPTRTDASLSETGIVQMEGTLHRAASMAAIPVDLQATWSDAQLGEATALLTGQDMGWRGTGVLHAALRGPLADAQLASTLELHNLRRTDFVPVRTLDLTVTCQAHATVTEATLETPSCSLPAPLAEGRDNAGKVELQAARFDITSRTATDLRFGIHASDTWLLAWARLLSPAIPPEENPPGSVDGSFTLIPASARQQAFWDGQLQGTVRGVLPWHKPGEMKMEYPFTLRGTADGFELDSVNLAMTGENPLSLRATANSAGYAVHLTGTATPGQVYELAQFLPPLRSGLETALPQPTAPHTSPTPAERIDLTCGRPWSAPAQTCTLNHAAEPTARKPGRRRR